jgi:hypothetical protein
MQAGCLKPFPWTCSARSFSSSLYSLGVLYFSSCLMSFQWWRDWQRSVAHLGGTDAQGERTSYT